MPVLDSLYTIGLLHRTRDEAVNAKDPTKDQTNRAVNIIREQVESAFTVQDAPQVGIAHETSNANAKEKEVMLLQSWNAKVIADRLDLPSLELEIERAVEQVEKALKKLEDEERQKQGGEIKTATNKDKSS